MLEEVGKQQELSAQAVWCQERLASVLKYAKDHNYQGYSKFDAMNSPLLEHTFGGSALGRLFFIQLVNRSPIQLRTILGVKKSRNPKGIANFLKTYATAYTVNPLAHYKSEAETLFDWLLEHRSERMLAGKSSFNGMCWGYNFPWENPSFYAPRHFPNAIVSVFCAEAFLRAYRVFAEKKYLEAAQETARFFLEDLPVLEETETTKCLGYVPREMKLKVVNINAVIAGFLSKLAFETRDSSYLSEAKKLITWVLGKKTDYHAWHYTEPPTSYVRNHDNYHSGGVIDGLFDYAIVSDDKECLEAYRNGLDFYLNELFGPNGEPKWRNKKKYPYDIHGSAQGILSCAKAAHFDSRYLDRGVKFARWADRNLGSPEGGFYYQKHQFYTVKFDLMRWNNSWMAWALAELCAAFASKKKELTGKMVVPTKDGHLNKDLSWSKEVKHAKTIQDNEEENAPAVLGGVQG